MGNEQHSLATYVSDMLALERHVRVPFDTQQKDDDFKNYEDASALVMRLAAVADQHIGQLNSTLEGLGGHEASPVKSAVVQFEGFFAGAIDKMRKTKVSKALRDDYTAISLCCASYSLLLATANALGETGIASLAQRFLEDYAQLVMEIGEALPGVAVQELRVNKIDVDTSTIESSRRQIEESWQLSGSKVNRTGTASSRGTVDFQQADAIRSGDLMP